MLNPASCHYRISLCEKNTARQAHIGVDAFLNPYSSVVIVIHHVQSLCPCPRSPFLLLQLLPLPPLSLNLVSSTLVPTFLSLVGSVAGRAVLGVIR